MRKERKEFKKIEYKDVFIATDGKEFLSEDECKKYEGTCECAINEMFNKVPNQATWAGNVDEFCTFGYDDTIYAIKIRDLTDVEVVNKWLKYKDSSARGIGADAIGTIQIFSGFDCYVNCLGTPDDLKQIYINAVDSLFNKLVEKAEDGESA